MKQLLLSAAVAVTALGASFAPAGAVVFYGGVTTSPAPGVGLGNGPGAVTFDTPSATTANLNSPAGYTENGVNFTVLSGSAAILNPGTSGSTGAEPFNDSTNYLSVLGGGSVKVTLASGVNSLSFYWGSIDGYNTLTFNDGTTFTGSQITPEFPTGCQQSASCNGLVTFLTGGPDTITSFTLSSSQNSFEVDNITAAVPEPTTWALLTIGFAGLGFLGYRRRSGANFRFA